MTGAHSMHALKDLRPGDRIDTLTQLDGRHAGVVTTDPYPATSVGQHTVSLTCTLCQAEHDVTDRSWRLVPAVRQPGASA